MITVRIMSALERFKVDARFNELLASLLEDIDTLICELEYGYGPDRLEPTLASIKHLYEELKENK